MTEDEKREVDREISGAIAGLCFVGMVVMLIAAVAIAAVSGG